MPRPIRSAAKPSSDINDQQSDDENVIPVSRKKSKIKNDRKAIEVKNERKNVEVMKDTAEEKENIDERKRKSVTDNQSSRTPVFKSKLPSCNILNYCKNYEMGLPCQSYRKPLKDIIINYCKTFRLYKVESPFDRRVTFIVWHPINPRVLSVTSHGGDVILYNYEEGIGTASIVNGIGAGGSVQSMKFDPLNPLQIYTVSMEGKFLVLNFHTKAATQFLATNDINRWYVSVDVNSNNNLMVAGDTKGGISILTIDGEEISTLQIHKKNCKVSHAEFSKREPWLLCTSSTDCTIKLWDIRQMKADPNSRLGIPLQTITHEKPVNAAYFSLTDGCRLLTTDQMDKISIYRAPLWNLETLIRHPHRQFQHLTPIKAYWHPYEDIVFVGRYPHEKFPGYHKNELRTIDFFDADSGDLLYQHYQSGFNGICSLNRFNITGDALASSYGQKFLIWKPDFKNLEKSSRIQENLERKRKKDNGWFSGDNGCDDDDDDDDDNDGDDVDWAEILKKQAKEKAKEKAREKKEIKMKETKEKETKKKETKKKETKKK